MDDKDISGAVPGDEETTEATEEARDEMEQALAAESLAPPVNEGEAAAEPSESPSTRLETEEPEVSAEAAEALAEVGDDMIPHEDGTTLEETETDAEADGEPVEGVAPDQPLLAESTLDESSLENLLVTGEMTGGEAEPEQHEEPVEEKPVIPPGPVTSRYGFVVLAAKRAKQLRDKAPAFIETDTPNVLSQSIKEVEQKKVFYRLSEEGSESSDS